MTILLATIPASILLGLLGLAAFLWALRRGQYRDLEGDAARILFQNEDAPPPPPRAASAEEPGRGSEQGRGSESERADG